MTVAGRGRARWLTILLGAALVGCETTVERPPSGRPLARDPVAAQEVPDGVMPNSMVLMLAGPKPTDTNGNGFPDLIVLDVYLFAEPFPAPMWSEGVFEFDLYPMGLTGAPDSRPLYTWRVEGDALMAARARSLVGRSYRIGLSILEFGSDVLPIPAVDLSARFTPTGGTTISSSGVRTVQLQPMRSG